MTPPPSIFKINNKTIVLKLQNLQTCDRFDKTPPPFYLGIINIWSHILWQMHNTVMKDNPSYEFLKSVYS